MDSGVPSFIIPPDHQDEDSRMENFGASIYTSLHEPHRTMEENRNCQLCGHDPMVWNELQQIAQALADVMGRRPGKENKRANTIGIFPQRQRRLQMGESSVSRIYNPGENGGHYHGFDQLHLDDDCQSVQSKKAPTAKAPDAKACEWVTTKISMNGLGDSYTFDRRTYTFASKQKVIFNLDGPTSSADNSLEIKDCDSYGNTFHFRTCVNGPPKKSLTVEGTGASAVVNGEKYGEGEWTI